MSVGSRIKELRKEAGYNRVAFAEKIGLPPTTLRNYETDKREPGHNFLTTMSKEFGVSVDYLLGLRTNRNPVILDDDGVSSKKHSLIESIVRMDEADVDVIAAAADALIARREK